MSDAKTLTVSEMAATVVGLVRGDGNLAIHSVADLDTAKEGDIAYVEEEKFFEAAKHSRASCLIVPIGALIDSASRIEVKNPKLAFALIAEVLHPPKKRTPEIHPSSVIAPNARIGNDVFIGAFVCIGEGSIIGDRTQLRAGAKIVDHVTVGEDCVIHPNVLLEDVLSIGHRVIFHA